MVLISLDSVRADALTFLDPEVTPNLCRLARRGTVFREARSGASWTLPAHAQLFTGQPPVLHGVHGDRLRIDPSTPTLPEVLSEAGWRAFGFFSGWYVAGEYGFARGFERYENAMEGAPGDGGDLGPEDAGTSREARLRAERASHRLITSEHLVERAREALDGLGEDEPLLLFAHFFDPHYDYVPPPPFDTRFDPGYTGSIDGRDYWANERIYDPAEAPPRRIGERDLEHVRALYQGEIAWTDRAIGGLLDLLREKGRLERAVVIVTADHGEEFFEHGERGHRQSLYDEVLRVPLLVVAPDAPVAGAPRMSDALVSLSDVMPTVLELCGLEVPVSVYGRSLTRELAGGGDAAGAAEEERALVASLVLAPPEAEGTAWLLESLTTPGRKLVRKLRLEPGGSPVLEAALWFDLERDPAELRPRANPARQGLRAAWDDLEAELARVRRFGAALPRSAPEARLTSVREQFAAELAGLGYAGAEEGAEAHSGDARHEWLERLLEPLPPLSLSAQSLPGPAESSQE